MQSFAFWYNSEEKIENISAKLNFNLWTECGWKKNPQFLDIGFLLNNWDKVQKINFFVPFEINNENVDDLGECFKIPELASAIFNENLQSAPDGDKKEFIVTNKDTGESFLIYCLDVKNDLQFESFVDSSNEKEDNSKGTIISIDLSKKEVDKSKDIYFRFRIRNINFDNLVQKYSSGKHGLQSVFNTTYTVDFRFFNKRSMGKTLLERINTEHAMYINSIHFLVITKTFVNFVTNNCKGRKLEEKIWDSYVKVAQKNHPTKDLIAYHFKENFKDLKDTHNGLCEFFIKYEIEKSILPMYLLLTIGLGAIGSFLATLFTHYVFPKC